MDLDSLIAALGRPSAYPATPLSIELRQTHISVVFLAGELVYKIKKPVNLGFLDFSTLERRKHFCEAEVRLNRRLAPDVYLGVVPVVLAGDGVRVEAPGEPIEYAVKMRRLPDNATLAARLEAGENPEGFVAELARRIAAFHAQAERSSEISRFGDWTVVAGNARENLDQAAASVGSAISREVLDRLRDRLESSLADLKQLIDDRCLRNKPCDTHGDLRPEHVYWFPDRPAPHDIVVMDCIEFNERFRFADPVSDIAFLVSELRFAGYGQLAERLADAYFAAAGDELGRTLLPFYVAYRAAVRGKVAGIKAHEPEVPARERASAIMQARGYWLQALAALEPPARRPCLVLVAGLPGAGKSTLAAELVEHAGFIWIRSDAVRKELAALEPAAGAPAAYGEGLYSADWNQRTYEDCLRRAEQELFAGHRVLVDASFREDALRQKFLAAAKRLGVSGLILACQAEPDETRRRLAARQGDASDADWAIYEYAARNWQSPSSEVAAVWHTIDTTAGRAESLDRAIDVLRAAGLFGH